MHSIKSCVWLNDTVSALTKKLTTKSGVIKTALAGLSEKEYKTATANVHDATRAHGGVSPRGPSNGWPARQTVNVWLALVGPPSPSGQGCAFGEGERVLREPRARRDALGPRVGEQRLGAGSRRLSACGGAPLESATQPGAAGARSTHTPRTTYRASRSKGPGRWAVAPPRRRSRQAAGASSYASSASPKRRSPRSAAPRCACAPKWQGSSASARSAAWLGCGLESWKAGLGLGLRLG